MVDGLVLGSVIALGAVGITLVYGVLRFAHFAHGDMMSLGAYLVLFLGVGVLGRWEPLGRNLGPLSFGWGFLLGLVGAALLTAGVSLALDRLFYRPLRQRRAGLVILAIASLGIAILLRSVIYIAWGPQPRFYTPGIQEFWRGPLGIRVRPDHLFILGVALALVAGLYLFLEKTRVGKALRAMADNPDLARVCGINTDLMVLWTWGLVASLAAVAGALLGVQSHLTPEMGAFNLIPLFAATILGGIGSPYGALVGAFIIGLVQQLFAGLVPPFISPAYKSGAAFLILFLLLLVRPKGLFRRV